MNRKSNIPKAKIDKGWKNMQAQLDEVMPVSPKQKRRPLAWWWMAAAVTGLVAGVVAMRMNTAQQPQSTLPLTAHSAHNNDTNISTEETTSIAASSNTLETPNPDVQISSSSSIKVSPTASVSISTASSDNFSTSNNLITVENVHNLPLPNEEVITDKPEQKAQLDELATLSPIQISNDFPAMALSTAAPTIIHAKDNFKFGMAAEVNMAADNRINGYQAAFVLDLFTHKRMGLRTGIGFRQIQFENNRNLVIPVTSDDLTIYTSNQELVDAFNPNGITATTNSRNNALPYVRRLTRIELPVNLRYAFGSRWVATAGINTVYTFDITAKSGELSFLNSFDQNTEKVADNAFNRIASNRYEVWTLDYAFGLEYRLHRRFHLGANWQQSIGENDTFKNNKRLNIFGLRGTYFFD